MSFWGQRTDSLCNYSVADRKLSAGQTVASTRIPTISFLLPPITRTTVSPALLYSVWGLASPGSKITFSTRFIPVCDALTLEIGKECIDWNDRKAASSSRDAPILLIIHRKLKYRINVKWINSVENLFFRETEYLSRLILPITDTAVFFFFFLYVPSLCSFLPLDLCSHVNNIHTTNSWTRDNFCGRMQG